MSKSSGKMFLGSKFDWLDLVNLGKIIFLFFIAHSLGNTTQLSRNVLFVMIFLVFLHRDQEYFRFQAPLIAILVIDDEIQLKTFWLRMWQLCFPIPFHLGGAKPEAMTQVYQVNCPHFPSDQLHGERCPYRYWRRWPHPGDGWKRGEALDIRWRELDNIGTNLIND